jgi:SSS family solute:Na+ symporter
MSLAGPRINLKAFDIDREMFRVKPATVVQIVITLVILTALYAKFW